MSGLIPSSTGSKLYVSPEEGGGLCSGGYLFAPSVQDLPPSVSLQDALLSYSGWFVQFPATAASDLPQFEEQAQVFFANPARENALIAWFTATTTLAAMVLYATKSEEGEVTATRTTEVSFGNFSIDIPLGAKISAAATQLGIAPGNISVTPTGQSAPSTLPLTQLGINFLGDAKPLNVITLAFTIADTTTSDLFDIGLRSFTAEVNGGYCQSTLHRVFDVSMPDATLALAGTIDPLAPLNTDRSYLSVPENSLSSYYQTASGQQISLKPAAKAGLVFTERLIAVDANGNPVVLPRNQSLYLAPAGSFEFQLIPDGNQVSASVSSLQSTLMGGLSTVEYLQNAVNPVLEFMPHMNAFAMTFSSGEEVDEPRVFGNLTNAGRTSWVQLATAPDTAYFAQPDSSVLHQSQDGSTDAAFLTYLPVSVGQLRDQQAQTNTGFSAFPMLPYRSVTGTNIDADDINNLETQVWSPKRRSIVQALVETNPKVRSLGAGDGALPIPPYSTTPQGLLLELGQGTFGFTWQNLTLGQSTTANTPENRSDRLILSDVTGVLQSALQTNQLFLVITGAEIMNACSSVPYSLTPVRQRQLALSITDSDVNAKLVEMVPKQWSNLTDLRTDLATQLDPTQMAEYFDTIRNGLGDFSLFVADWEFDLSPWRWVTHNTILVFKFCNKKLSQLVDDTTQWASATDFNTSPKGTRQRIQQILDTSLARYEAGDNDLAYFVNTVMESDTWNGVLALNAQVPLTGLPPQLEGLAAGIDASRFQAHHVGISVTPVAPAQGAGSKYTSSPSSVFGLIDYEDEADLTGSDPYDFKVNSLKVGIANSEIVSFSSKIELLINKLFTEPCTQNGSSTGNNLVLYGIYQKSGNSGTYVFSTVNATSYGMTSEVLNSVGIRSASFVTVTDGEDVENLTTVVSTFTLTGAISFINQAQFDLFSYGTTDQSPGDNNVSGLAYSNLSIDMSFDPGTPQYRNFAFDAQSILMDTSNSQVRPESLASHFPMKLTSLTQGLGDVTPNSLAFMPVDSPLEGSELSAPWFGLNYELDLGSAGALAAKIDFTASLILAWAPSGATSGPKIYIGLHLPGVKGGERAIPIESVLKLAFADITFLVAPPTYILKLGDIALKLLALSFPPNGQIDLLMFGNPDAQTSGALGWYASYVKNGAGKAGGKTEPRLTALKSQTALSDLKQAMLTAQEPE
ncbi:hemagglutinin [Marinobacter sp.]|uniref:hemagglutinin n=1 Tax=Gammaproteobacteria TaxID=1236 RepID=UPI003A930D9E